MGAIAAIAKSFFDAYEGRKGFAVCTELCRRRCHFLGSG